MITDCCQRWRRGRASYRPRGEPIPTRDYEVAPITRPPAKAFVKAHHYSHSCSQLTRQYGLFRHDQLVGVAVYGNSMNRGVFRELTLSFSSLPREQRPLELGRFVLLDDVPANGETWFLARTFELLRAGGRMGVVSFSDPMPREDLDGNVVHPGHVGTIYQAHNAVYVGLASPRTMWLLPDGTSLNKRSLDKLLRHERSRRHVGEQLVRAGAAPRRDEPEDEWARRWAEKLSRRIRHRGNHKYVWALDRAARRSLPRSLAYPKLNGALFA